MILGLFGIRRRWVWLGFWSSFLVRFNPQITNLMLAWVSVDGIDFWLRYSRYFRHRNPGLTYDLRNCVTGAFSIMIFGVFYRQEVFLYVFRCGVYRGCGLFFCHRGVRRFRPDKVVGAFEGCSGSDFINVKVGNQIEVGDVVGRWCSNPTLPLFVIFRYCYFKMTGMTLPWLL